MISHKKRIVIFDENEFYNSIAAASLSKAQFFNLVSRYQNFCLMTTRLKLDKPDVILMDLPCAEGVRAIREVKELKPDVQVVVLSVHQRIEDVVNALRFGADGYVIKHLNGNDLIQALDKMYFGGVALSASVARTLVQEFWRPRNNPLSGAEIKVLKLMSNARTYTAIAEDLQISAQTVKVHTRNIYRKLNVHCKSEAIAIAQQGRLIN
ncbi:MAG TPA: response regulator transcription factor [Cyclobacteriaceae bacterium]|nr:response regulator transcription factor [Cyclobacteriaceae bacterium]HMV09442.1 response regulator transcription factor [Cyclobacteriaceae bacterium]HMV89471.1 response regulator transcription factor [Cyclobacteriaceae bacterium]HMX02463.1 response regulator transcription factor [Cyclobacteriaceae bacterium]HMX51049.1 response regulator transcription factor [Cyclobacteriaceae bacterium]